MCPSDSPQGGDTSKAAKYHQQQLACTPRQTGDLYMRLRAGTVSDTPTYPHDWGARKPRHFATLFSKRGADNVLTTPRSR